MPVEGWATEFCDADLNGSTVQLVRQTRPYTGKENSTWGTTMTRSGWTGPVRKNSWLRCENSIAKREAKALVGQSLQVSPATHPPCNVWCAEVLRRAQMGFLVASKRVALL